MKDPITGKTVTEKCLELLRRPEGATVDELVAVTGWKRTSVGGFIYSPITQRTTTEEVLQMRRKAS